MFLVPDALHDGWQQPGQAAQLLLYVTLYPVSTPLRCASAGGCRKEENKC